MKNPLYVTTTLPYVNADPHIGFAFETIQADAYVRFSRLECREVFFNAGSDEHGQKIWQKAAEKGQDVQEYVDHYAGEVQKLSKLLNWSYDAFIRTTDEKHIRAAEEIWRRCEAKGDIYKKKFSGLYCVGCELFLTEKDLVNGECPLHPGKKLEMVEEENYFFKFSNYENALKAYLRDDVIIPLWRKHEALNFVNKGLEDFSVSRLKSRMPWGIGVPGDPDHVMYVWFDALTSYISTLGWPEGEDFDKFWAEAETLQFAGKDQVRMQSLMWQAMLLSADLPHTDRIFYHGFINSGGQRMSKTVGNVIHPLSVVEKYGTDTLRYYLLRHVHPVEDSDVTLEKIHEAYTANLVNGIGNLTSRVLTMIESYEVEVEFNSEDSVWNDPEFDEYKDLIRGFKFNEAMDYLWEGVNGLDGFIASEEPYKKIKTDPDKAKEDVAYAAIRLWDIAVLLAPFMPETALRMKALINAKKKPEAPLFERK